MFVRRLCRARAYRRGADRRGDFPRGRKCKVHPNGLAVMAQVVKHNAIRVFAGYDVVQLNGILNPRVKAINPITSDGAPPAIAAHPRRHIPGWPPLRTVLAVDLNGVLGTRPASQRPLQGGPSQPPPLASLPIAAYPTALGDHRQ